MKKLFLLLVLVLGICETQSAFCQSSIHGYTIDGEIVGIETDSIKIEYYNSPSSFIPVTATHYSKVVNGRFHFNLGNLSRMPFGSIKVFRDSPDGYIIINDFFLTEPEDHIHITLSLGDPIFSGKGSAKYNFMVWLTHLISDQNQNSYKRIDDPIENIEYQNSVWDKIEKNAMAVLYTNKDKISAGVISILQLTINAMHANQELVALRSNTDSVVRVYLSHHPIGFAQLEKPNDLSVKAANFGDALILKEQIIARLKTRGEEQRSEKMFESVKNGYKGVVRDKLLSIMALWDSYHSGLNLDSITNEINDSYYKTTVLNYVDRLRIGSMVFDGQFSDMNGKVVNISDFKGKVVILDVYFTGCSGCIRLSQAMTPVLDAFQDNPNVVLLSINEDKKRDLFIAAVKSQRYTHAQSVNVYTNGQGEEHPFTKHYQLVGAPQYMIIGKDGRILLANSPQAPNLNRLTGEVNPNDSGVLAWIDIIKKALSAN
ncbi:peroxiredoxin [Mucilaginibacter gracilis]|uniref:Peroxiredoxin n=1 Tax=Mucilaginibacter gracilis TaxID=423350 RepID=A0A495J169_9SPHI|nr:TlpA disulfide reductase family protein [Mucilaginibacter gracilis]RKR82088.1 peroxiredoxin [Mucilaginibacter gracilis]